MVRSLHSHPEVFCSMFHSTLLPHKIRSANFPETQIREMGAVGVNGRQIQSTGLSSALSDPGTQFFAVAIIFTYLFEKGLIQSLRSHPSQIDLLACGSKINENAYPERMVGSKTHMVLRRHIPVYRW
jgi:hypothetical protein